MSKPGFRAVLCVVCVAFAVHATGVNAKLARSNDGAQDLMAVVQRHVVPLALDVAINVRSVSPGCTSALMALANGAREGQPWALKCAF